MKTRSSLALCVALLVAMVLSGCTATEPKPPNALSEVKAAIEGIPTVKDISFTTPAVNKNSAEDVAVGVQVLVEEFAEAELIRIVQAVSSVVPMDPVIDIWWLGIYLEDPPNANPVAGLEVTYPILLPEKDLANDIRYWLAISAIGGPVEMALRSGVRTPSASYSRTTTWAYQETDNWAAIRAVPDPSLSDKHWDLAGPGLDWLSSEGSMPPESVTALFSQLQFTARGEAGWEVRTYYDQESEHLGVSLSSNAGPGSVAPLLQSPVVLEAVRGLSDAGMRTSSFQLSRSVPGGSIHVGECEKLSEMKQSDYDLWDALAMSIPDLPPGSGPGDCDYR